MNPKIISVIIILKNDIGIINTITGLNNQDYKGKIEIIIVDRSTIKYPKINSKIPLRWINYNPDGKRYTIPEQRNVGIVEAKGSIIIFLDANCIPNKNWLTEMVDPIKKEDESIVSGVTLSSSTPTLNDIQFKKTKKYISSAGTNNLAFIKKIINSVGLFDTNFEYGSDVEFSWRLILKGYKIRFQPTAISYHDWGDTDEEIKRSILYGKASARIYFKHWSTRWQRLLGPDAPVIIYPLIILATPLYFIYPWLLLILVLLTIKNLKNMHPIGTVLKNIVFGLGVLIEVKSQLFKYFNWINAKNI